MLLFSLFCIFVLCVLYSFYTSHQNVKRITANGVLYMGSFMANVLRTIVKGESVTENVLHRYNMVKNANQKFGVEMEFGTPSYFLADLDLIKHITIKDFDHFVNPRKVATSKKKDDLVGRMLFSLEGAEWRALRSKMSPTFTTGRIKRMFHIMNSSGKKLVSYLKNQIENGELINIQEGFSKFTMDFISSAAFGLDTKSFENETPSVFEEYATKIQFKLDLNLIWKITAVNVFPTLADWMGISIFDLKSQQFFRDVIANTIKVRQQNRNEKRNDFLELMLEARDGQLKAEEAEQNSIEPETVKFVLEEIDIAAQSVIFIMAGFDTVKSALQFAAYNLALHPEVQERLFQELHLAVEDNDGELSYEMLNDLKYLDQVISESLRILPVAAAAMRTCTADYQVPDSKAVISKGSIIVIPIYAIHHDPDYFPEPERFDPERFSPENRTKMVPNSYMPFGQGPRNCIAMRLALVELKSAVAQLVLNFVMEPSEKTQIPMKFSNSVNLSPLNGIWLKLHSRN